MGHMGAQAFADGVAEGNVSIDIALVWHLRSNHFPPLPFQLVDVAKKAIALANDGVFDEVIDLPVGIDYRDKLDITVTEAIESMHLESFISWREDY